MQQPDTYTVRTWPDALLIVGLITGGDHSIGAGRIYPRPYALLGGPAMDGAMQFEVYRVERYELGEKVAQVVIAQNERYS